MDGIPYCIPLVPITLWVLRFNPAADHVMQPALLERKPPKNFYVEVVCWGEKFHFLFGMTLEVKKYDNNI
jgi:hypothetical protein